MNKHTQVFSYTDNDGDHLRVEHIEEGASPIGRRLIIDTRDGGDVDRVQVALSKDDALRLAKAITDALEPGLTVKQLDALEPPERVADAAGQRWTKTLSGDWYSTTTWRDITSRELHGYGPIKAVRA